MILKGSDLKMLIFQWFFKDLKGSDLKMLIFKWFFNDSEGFGFENVGFSMFFQWFLGVSVAIRICQRSRRTPQGRIQGAFSPPEEPSGDPLSRNSLVGAAQRGGSKCRVDIFWKNLDFPGPLGPF